MLQSDDATQSAHDRFTALYLQEWAWRQEQLLRRIGVANRLPAKLPDQSEAAHLARMAYLTKLMGEIAALRAAPLAAADAEDLEVFAEQAETLYDNWRFRDYDCAFNCFATFWDDPLCVIAEQTFITEPDYAALLPFLKGISGYIAQNIDSLRRGMAFGYMQPVPVVSRVLGSVRATASAAPEASPYYAPFLRAKIALPDAMTSEALRLIRDEITPAYGALLEFFETVYRPAAPTAPSISRRHPAGKEVYQAKIREYTTLNISPDAAFALGSAEVEKVSAEMLALVRASGEAQSIADYAALIAADPGNYAKSEEEILSRAARICSIAEGAIATQFGHLPRRRFAIEPIPEAEAASAPIGRFNGIAYQINTSALDKRPLHMLPVLSLHEAIPGHCFQGAIALENQSRPIFRREHYAIAYGNAWALYCEKRVGQDLGVYRSTAERFGMLSFMQFRAARMVVDTGLHSQDWSREAAIAYLAENTTLSAMVIEAEVDRMISWPGQGLGYYLGMLSIEISRAKAEAALGSAFDVRAFHDTILEMGPVPMSLLEARLERFIAEGGPSPYR